MEVRQGEWRWFRGWNVVESVVEGSEVGGEWFEDEQDGDGDYCGGFVGEQQWLSVGLRAMWNANTVSVLTVMSEQEEADSWCSFNAELIENCAFSAACSPAWTGISSGGTTKVISNAHHQNSTDLIMEPSVTDLSCPENYVTISCSSTILKYANAGRQRQRKAVQTEALVDASNLQQNCRRPFILTRIVESRVGQDRRICLDDLKFFSAFFKVLNAPSLRLVEDDSATSNQPEVLQHQQPYSSRRYGNSVLCDFINYRLEIDLDVVALHSTPVDDEVYFFISISVNEACARISWISQESYFCKPVALLVKVPV